VNAARSLTRRFRSVRRKIAALMVKFERAKFHTTVASMWTTTMDVLRLKRVGALKLMMYRVLDLTFGDPSTSAAWWFVNGLTVKQVTQLDEHIFDKFRAVGDPIEWQAHDGAYSTQRIITHRISTREGAARAAKAAKESFVAGFKSMQVDQNGDPKPWKTVKGNKNREPRMKAVLFAATLEEFRRAPGGRPRTTLRPFDDFMVPATATGFGPQRCDVGAPPASQQHALTSTQWAAFLKSFVDTRGKRSVPWEPMLSGMRCPEFGPQDIFEAYARPAGAWGELPASEIEIGMRAAGLNVDVSNDELHHMQTVFFEAHLQPGVSRDVLKRLVLMHRALDVNFPDQLAVFEQELQQVVYERIVAELKVHPDDPRDLERYMHAPPVQDGVADGEDNTHCGKRLGYGIMRQYKALIHALEHVVSPRTENYEEHGDFEEHLQHCVNPSLCGICQPHQQKLGPAHDPDSAADGAACLGVALTYSRFAHIAKLYSRKLDVQHGDMAFEPFCDQSYHAALCWHGYKKTAITMQVIGGALRAMDESHLQEDYRCGNRAPLPPSVLKCNVPFPLPLTNDPVDLAATT
jgi:hypothetical protein